ncbi:hypothetical protein [Woeseia oceani]|uniref:Yip1 domain-containing protein n=1 Tax=Woeseia oceani TaxID=1548547 RepID=A0A193LI81_9GAMM|nr:hypothetical protein [Woeseia oceani]ANO52225.1 hypothetical protein BA177_14410 [Woeseia oceani]
MLLLLKSFFDIIALRRGPESIPSSMFVLTFAIVLMLASSYPAYLITASEESHYATAFFAYGAGILFYAAVIVLAGRAERLLVAVSCIIACGSLLTIVFALEFAIFAPLLGRVEAGAIASMIILWSVPVEGHIMSKSIGCHWLLGLLIAIASLVTQIGVQAMLGGS